MSFLLRLPPDASLAEQRARLRDYRRYLDAQQKRMPVRAWEFAAAEWHYDPDDHRCPHDAWVNRLEVLEIAESERHQNRALEIRLELLGAYHDGRIRLVYPGVTRYSAGRDAKLGGMTTAVATSTPMRVSFYLMGSTSLEQQRLWPDGALSTRCIGCGGLVPRMDGPTHRYLESSPGCWHLYGEVLAREYSDSAFRVAHRLTVDSYAVQHPGRPSAQSIQSVCIHLMSLCLVVERGLAAAYATRVMGAATRVKERFFWLTPPDSLGAVTISDVASPATAPQHEQRIRAWAESAWSAWADHHATIRGWLPA